MPAALRKRDVEFHASYARSGLLGQQVGLRAGQLAQHEGVRG